MAVTKAQLLEQVQARGIPADESLTKADLQALLDHSDLLKSLAAKQKPVLDTLVGSGEPWDTKGGSWPHG